MDLTYRSGKLLAACFAIFALTLVIQNSADAQAKWARAADGAWSSPVWAKDGDFGLSFVLPANTDNIYLGNDVAVSNPLASPIDVTMNLGGTTRTANSLILGEVGTGQSGTMIVDGTLTITSGITVNDGLLQLDATRTLNVGTLSLDSALSSTNLNGTVNNLTALTLTNGATVDFGASSVVTTVPSASLNGGSTLIFEQASGDKEGLALSTLDFLDTSSVFQVTFDAATDLNTRDDWGLRLDGDQVTDIKAYLASGQINVTNAFPIGVLYDGTNTFLTAIPEPSSLAILGLLGCVAGFRRKRR